VAVAGDYAYVSVGQISVDRSVIPVGEDGLQVVDVSDPNAPHEVGFYKTQGVALNVALEGNYAYVAIPGVGLEVLDVSDPTAPKVVSFYSMRDVVDVAVVADYAYVAGVEDGLRVVDFSHLPLIAARRLRALGVGALVSLALVVLIFLFRKSLSRLRCLLVLVLALTVPSLALLLRVQTAANEIGRYDTPGEIRAVAVKGDYAYLAYHEGNVVEKDKQGGQLVRTCGVRVLDISDPTAPKVVGSYYVPMRGDALSVAVAGDYAYLVHPFPRTFGDGQGLYVMNISEPAGHKNYPPEPAGSHSSIYWSGGMYYTRDPRHVAVAGDYAYVADGRTGLRVIDISEPADLHEVGFYMP